MPRRGKAVRRPAPPADPHYGNQLATKFINRLMQRGKKTVAMRIFYGALDTIAERNKKDPLEVFNQAVRNATPMLEVRPRRVGGATYQVPLEVGPRRGQSLAIRWIIWAALARPGKSMEEKLAAEFWDAFNSTGTAIKKREDMHRMAEANKAFAHYRW